MAKAARKSTQKPAAPPRATMSVQGMRGAFADTINRVAYGKERVRVERHGKPIAALVPIEDLELMERLEDAADVREADRVLHRVRTGRERVIGWPATKEKLGG